MNAVEQPRRLALALSVDSAVAPAGVDQDAFSRACLADTYEVLAGLAEVQAGVAGAADEETAELLWPGDRAVPDRRPHAIAAALTGAGEDGVDELVLVAGDAPDLPALVVAKMFRALRRAEVCLAPDRVLPGCVALGVRLPWPGWLPTDLGLDVTEPDLTPLAPRRSALALTPDWHRLRTAAALQRLDPGLEGWEETRLLIS